MLKPFQKLQFAERDSPTLRADLLNKLGGALSSIFQQILGVIGEATFVPLPSSTVVSETTAGQAASAGTAATFSRGDHTHGTPPGQLLQATVDFGTAAPTPDAVTATISDTGVAAGSKFQVSVSPASGRDMDEMELGPVIVGWGNIVAGVSFDVIAVAVDGTAHGQYTVNATRS